MTAVVIGEAGLHGWHCTLYKYKNLHLLWSDTPVDTIGFVKIYIYSGAISRFHVLTDRRSFPKPQNRFGITSPAKYSQRGLRTIVGHLVNIGRLDIILMWCIAGLNSCDTTT